MMHTVAKGSRACKARVNSQSDFSMRIFRMSFLLLRKITKNQSPFAVGGLRGPRRHLQLSERSELSSQSPL